MSSSFTDPFNEEGKDAHFLNAARQQTISNHDYVEFINCITLTDWIQARDKVLTDPKYHGHFKGGAFTLYELAAIYAQGENEKEMRNTLSFFETIYVLAEDKAFTALCDFIDAIDANMVIMSIADLDVYVKHNMRCFGNAFRGLLRICLQHIPVEDSDFQEGEQHYWETILRKIYMVYRMIENQEGNAKAISGKEDSKSEESWNAFEQEFHQAYQNGQLVIPEDIISLWNQSEQMHVVREMFETRIPKGNNKWFESLSMDEQGTYYILFYKYIDMLYQWFIEEFQLRKYDEMLCNSRNKLKPIDMKEMDLYQYLGSRYLKFFYIRNNVYLERLHPNELRYLVGRLQCADNTLNEKDVEFLKKTFVRLLPENIDKIEGKHTLTNYGPNKDLDYIRLDNVIVIGVRHAEYYVANEEEKAKFNEISNDRALAVETVISIFDEKKWDWSKKYGIHFSIIQYDDFSVESLTSHMVWVPQKEYYYFESGDKVVMTNGYDWYWRDKTHHKWIKNNDWERLYYDAAYKVIEINYDEPNEQVLPLQRE